MKHVCIDCGLEYRPHKVGVSAVEMFCDPPQPYKIATGDIYKCPGCGHEIMVGFSRPIYHHEDRFQSTLKSLGKNIVTVWETAARKAKK